MWAKLKSRIIMDIARRHIPQITIKNKYSPAWIDAEVIHASHHKKCALNKFKKTKRPQDETRFKHLRNQLKNLVSRKYKEYIANITNNIGTNPKRFWTLLKDRSKAKTSPSIISKDGVDHTDPNAKSHIFNQYFQSVFTSKTHDPFPPVHKTRDDALENVVLTEQEVLKELNSINTSKAPGPDGLTTHVLKACAAPLVSPITTLFNQSLQTGKIPSDWRKANVVPIHKKGPKTDPMNYRPISLLPIISKIMERCIFNHIIPLLTPKITSLQHGFMKGKSTLTQLMTALTNINKIFDQKSPTDVIYFDLSKAFDTVPHDLLLHKLQTFGIHGRLLSWIESYLTNRLQRVTCDGGTSEWLPVSSGVPQGSILGPLLFLLYRNDLPSVLSPETMCAIFADDTKIYREILTPADNRALQEDINALVAWGKTWDLNFNQKKCVSLNISYSPTQVPHIYNMNNTALSALNTMNDLGVLVTNNLRWTQHIDKIISKANQRLFLTIRTLGYDAPQKAKRLTYISMVRSILEYNSPIWTPQDKENLRNLERCQRQATNFIVSNVYRTLPNYKDYKTRLLECNLLPLSFRREITDLILFCRSYNHDLAYNIRDYVAFNTPGQGRSTRQQTSSDTLKLPKTKTTQAAHFYPTRIARLWNSLPQHLRKLLKPLRSSLVIKQHLIPYYRAKLATCFDPENLCTWINTCQCNHCKII